MVDRNTTHYPLPTIYHRLPTRRVLLSPGNSRTARAPRDQAEPVDSTRACSRVRQRSLSLRAAPAARQAGEAGNSERGVLRARRRIATEVPHRVTETPSTDRLGERYNGPHVQNRCDCAGNDV